MHLGWFQKKKKVLDKESDRLDHWFSEDRFSDWIALDEIGFGLVAGFSFRRK